MFVFILFLTQPWLKSLHFLDRISSTCMVFFGFFFSDYSCWNRAANIAVARATSEWTEWETLLVCSQKSQIFQHCWFIPEWDGCYYPHYLFHGCFPFFFFFFFWPGAAQDPFFCQHSVRINPNPNPNVIPEFQPPACQIAMLELARWHVGLVFQNKNLKMLIWIGLCWSAATSVCKNNPENLSCLCCFKLQSIFRWCHFLLLNFFSLFLLSPRLIWGVFSRSACECAVKNNVAAPCCTAPASHFTWGWCSKGHPRET